MGMGMGWGMGRVAWTGFWCHVLPQLAHRTDMPPPMAPTLTE